MKRLILFFGTLLAGFVLFGVLISGVGWQEVREPLQAFSFFKALVILLLTGGYLLLGVFRWQSILRGQGHVISFQNIWKEYLAGFSLLFFVPIFPFANELFRATSLKEHHDVELTKGMASVVVDRILEITSNLFVVIVGGVIFLFLGDHISYSTRTIAVIGFIGIWLFLLFLLYVRMFQKKSILRLFWKGNGRFHETEEEVFRLFHTRNSFFWQGVFLSLGKSALGIVRVWAVVLFFGKGFVALPGITIHGFYYLALLLPIPGALGTHEALQAVAFGVFGLGAGTGAAFALVVRAAEVLFAAAGLALLLHFGVRFLKNMIFVSHEQ